MARLSSPRRRTRRRTKSYDASIPFGSKLSQLQGHLEGFDSTQGSQVACHLQTMVQRLRRLAGMTSLQVTDRFQRLEALIASYFTGDVEVPLSLQIWSEGQLRVLIPYLNGGRTPDTVAADGQPTMGAGGCQEGLHGSTTGASSSGDAIHIEDSAEAEAPDYRVRRTPQGPWEPATAQEAAEFRAHDEALMEEERVQEAADRLSQHEAALAQRWEDWAVRSEMDCAEQPPSKKRIRITICAGTGSGQTIGEASVEGVIAHDQQAIVSFNVVETMVGGVMPMTNMTAAHANPQLACYDKDHLPGLSESVQAFMVPMEGRHWLWRFAENTVGLDEVEARFGQDIAEAFQLWVAMQMDTEKEVKNVAECLVEDGQSSSSESATVPVERPLGGVSSTEGADVARVAEDDGEEGHTAVGDALPEGCEVEGVSNFVRPGGMDAAHEINATMPDSLPEDDSVLRAGLGEALHGRSSSREMNEDGQASNEGMGSDNGHGEGCGVAEPGNMEVGSEMDVCSDEPYKVPPEWERVLNAWNDPAIGAGLPDSVLSCGNFQHDVAGVELDGNGQAVGEAVMDAAVASIGASSSRSRSSTERAEGSERGPKQTNLKGWLQ